MNPTATLERENETDKKITFRDGLFSVHPALDNILNKWAAWLWSMFRNRTNTVLENESLALPVSVPSISISISVPSVNANGETMKKQRQEPVLRRVEKLNGGINAERRKLYGEYRSNLAQNPNRPDIAEFANKESFLFDILTRVLRKFGHDKNHPSLGKLIPEKEPFAEYVNHIIFVLRQTIIGSVVPTSIEMRYIRAILSDEQVKEAILKILDENGSHPRVQSLRFWECLHRQSLIIRQLLGDDSHTSRQALDDILLHFSGYFPTNLEQTPDTDTVLPAETPLPSNVVRLVIPPRKPIQRNVIVPLSNASVTSISIARTKRNILAWKRLASGETREDFWFTIPADFHALQLIDGMIPCIMKKKGACTYSVKKVTMDDYMTELSKKRPFDHMLRNIFSKSKTLKRFNALEDMRIPAAILSDLMDGTPITSDEMSFISWVIVDADFSETFSTEFQKLQSDSRIGDFGMIKYPYITSDMILGFLSEKSRAYAPYEAEEKMAHVA